MSCAGGWIRSALRRPWRVEIELIVRRPAVEAREVITCGELCTTNGLIGDNWNAKPTSATGMPTPRHSSR